MLLYTTDTESAFGGSANAIRDPDLVADWKRNSVLFLDTAVRNGSVDALVKLATANNNGIIVERNPTEAYAYYLAAHRAMPQATSEKLLGRYREELISAAGCDQKGRRNLQKLLPITDKEILEWQTDVTSAVSY